VTETIEDAAITAKPPASAAPMPWRLPWLRTIALIATIGFACGVIGWLIGRPSDPTFNDVDIGFLADMSEHHSGALTLAFAYLPKGQDPTLTSMAREVITDQAQEIGLMNGLLTESGDQPTVGDGISMDWMGHSVPSRSMPGLATKADYDRLATEQGQTADIDFSKLMIDHHEAGIEMADYAARDGSNDAVRELARKMAKTQRFEIREMNLRRRFLGFHAVHPSTLIPTHG
jgi:uncharacterized protein (DUF305 family)